VRRDVAPGLKTEPVWRLQLLTLMNEYSEPTPDALSVRARLHAPIFSTSGTAECGFFLRVWD